MGKITTVIPDGLEERLRVKASKKFGLKRGYLQQALTEAIEKWIEET